MLCAAPLTFVQVIGFSSLTLWRHLQRLTPSCAPTPFDQGRASRKLSCPSAFARSKDPVFLLKGLSPILSTRLACRVWLPSLRLISSLHPQRPLSAFNALGLHSSEPFSFPGVNGSFRTHPSTHAVSRKTFRLISAASVASSPQESCSLFSPPKG